jgi:ADP-L-glycero-D-manno-heptose 6-epimerase
MGLEPRISFIDMPEALREKYQYFTQASIVKLKKAGYTGRFYSLEEGVRDYVQNYLMQDKKIY